MPPPSCWKLHLANNPGLTQPGSGWLPHHQFLVYSFCQTWHFRTLSVSLFEGRPKGRLAVETICFDKARPICRSKKCEISFRVLKLYACQTSLSIPLSLSALSICPTYASTLAIYLIYISLCISHCISLQFYISIFTSIYISLSLSIYLSRYLSMYLCVYPSMYLCVCVSVCLSIYPSIYMFHPSTPSIYLIFVQTYAWYLYIYFLLCLL